MIKLTTKLLALSAFLISGTFVQAEVANDKVEETPENLLLSLKQIVSPNIANTIKKIGTDRGFSKHPGKIMADEEFAFNLENSNSKNSHVSTHAFARGLTLYKNLGNGKFEKLTNTGLDWMGFGAGGAEFVDFDNDGWADIYVTNGLWSGTQRDEDLGSYFVRAVAAKFSIDRPALDYTRSGFMEILTGYKGGIIDANKKGTLSMAGYQRNRLFRNNQDGTYTEMGYVAGVDSIADGYVVATADLNRDGKMDLILRNADPGTLDYTFPTLQVFTNNTPTSNKSVILSFQGTLSNRDGIGTKAIATIGNDKITQELSANNGAAQSERILNIGMGSAKSIDTLEVRWPSGTKHIYRNVQPGRFLIKESDKTITEQTKIASVK